jgi:hypothetical protein
VSKKAVEFMTDPVEIRFNYDEATPGAGPLLENVLPVSPMPGNGSWITRDEAFEAWDSRGDEEE